MNLYRITTIIIDKLDQLQRFFLVLVSILLVLGVSLQVFLRYILKSNLMGIDEIIILIAFWLYFIGGSYGASNRTHITADLTEVYLKNNRLKKNIQLIASAITIIISVIFTSYSVKFFLWGLEKGATSSVLNIPMVISQSSIFIGFVLMTFYFIVHFIKDLVVIIKLDTDFTGGG